MTLKNLSLMVAILLGLATFAPVFAQSYGTAGVSADLNAGTSAGGASATVSATTSVKLGATETKAKGRGDQEIDRRDTALQALDTRVQGMQMVTAAFKTSLDSAIQAQLATFVALKAKIDADTDVPTLKADIQSITKSYRIFALVLPQGRIAAAADRVATIVTMMDSLGSKLQARISAASQGGADVTALTAALTDMSAKLSDAQTQAQGALSVSAQLQPDNGDATVMASNTAALKTARADIKTAVSDIVAARKDAATIIVGLKKIEASTNASSTTTVTP